MKKRLLCFAVLLLAGAASIAPAQNYPVRPVKLLMGFPAGGQSDIVARFVAQAWSSVLGQPVVVEPKLGAAGIVSLTLAAKSAPDGYTLVIANAGLLTIENTVDPKLPYSPVKDFAPVVVVGGAPVVFEVSAKLPVKTVAEFIALAKAKPGVLNHASSSGATISSLLTLQFKQQSGVSWNTVSYKGAGTKFADLISGQVDFVFDNLSSSVEYIKAGQLRPLAISKKTDLLPGVPTLREAGIKVEDAVAWHGIVAPAGTPPAIIQKLNSELVRILKQPETIKKLQDIGLDVIGGTPADFANFMRAENARWAKVISESGVKFRE